MIDITTTNTQLDTLSHYEHFQLKHFDKMPKYIVTFQVNTASVTKVLSIPVLIYIIIL